MRSDMTCAIAQHSPDDREPSPEVVVTATRWFLRLQEEDVSDQDRSACHQWRQADEMHDLAWRRLETLWRNFDSLEGNAARPAQTALAKLATRKRDKRRLKRAIGAAIACCGVAVLLSDAMHPYLLADHHTGLAQRETLTLPDGSQVTLDAHSAVDIRYSQTERRIVLREGQILAQVHHDQDNRPFIVQTAHGTATALGTRYTVSLLGKRTIISVIESSVRACPQTSTPVNCMDLKPGQSATVAEDTVSRMNSSGYTDPASWTQGYLALDNQPLSRVLHMLRAYHSGVMWYDDRDLDSVRVSGVIPIDDSSQAFGILAQTLPIQIRQYSPWAVTIKKTN